MKKFLLLSLVLLVGQSFAALPEQTIVLRKHIASLEPLNPDSVNVLVFADGYVSAQRCDENSCPFVVSHFSAEKMDNIQRLIQEAEKGQITRKVLECAAVPTESYSYTANNEDVTLLSGTRPCGQLNQNTADVSQELVEILDSVQLP